MENSASVMILFLNDVDSETGTTRSFESMFSVSGTRNPGVRRLIRRIRRMANPKGDGMK
jgi:hypothetical protein